MDVPRKSNYLIAIPIAVFLMAAAIIFNGRKEQERTPVVAPPVQNDVAEFETNVYDGVWTLPRADLNVVLTALSNRLILSSSPSQATSRLRQLKLEEAVDALGASHSRAGALPAAFADRLMQHLEKTGSEGHLGLWSKTHDYSALACIVDPSSAAYLRERILAIRAAGFRYERRDLPKQYWLVDEKAAREHLCTLTPSDPDCKVKEVPPNVFHTKPGYFAAVTKPLLDRGISIAASGDDLALARYLVSPGVIQLDRGTEVIAVESGGILSGTVKFRRRGEITEYWTVREALER